MRRALATPLLAVVLTLLFLPPAARAQAESVAVIPASGSQSETFLFLGKGFSPGAVLVVAFAAPDGQIIGWYQKGTSDPFIITADELGSWAFSVLPSEELVGFPLGEWTATFCLVGSHEYCYSGTFTITD
ncbi:MAG: hypothetical protein KatS3mg061_0125 [Dehalococcoidia bacterium]|nr:MAG: hypothetical protein KatS3mg061_0125 [Dehalococcoidia bacterium]